MAGRSLRFKNVGIEIPKWQIEIDDKTMLFWALNPFRSVLKRVVFVANRSDSPKKLIHRVCAELSITNYEILELEETPDGQAITASLGLKLLPNSDPFVIWNIDTMLVPKSRLNLPNQGCWLTLTNLPGNSWSFAKVNGVEVVEVAEKVRISDWASIGLYGFPNPEEYILALQNQHKDTKSLTNEAYVAPLYGYFLSRGFTITPHFVKTNEIVPLGTPQDLLFAHSNGIVKVQSSVLKILQNNMTSLNDE